MEYSCPHCKTPLEAKDMTGCETSVCPNCHETISNDGWEDSTDTEKLYAMIHYLKVARTVSDDERIKWFGPGLNEVTGITKVMFNRVRIDIDGDHALFGYDYYLVLFRLAAKGKWFPSGGYYLTDLQRPKGLLPPGRLLLIKMKNGRFMVLAPRVEKMVQ